MKLIRNIISDQTCGVSLVFALLFGVNLPTYIIANDSKAIINVSVLLGVCIVIFLWRLWQTKRIFETGKDIVADIEFIRRGILTRCYVKLSFELDGETFQRKIELASNQINKNMTAKLKVNPANLKQFRVMFADDAIS